MLTGDTRNSARVLVGCKPTINLTKFVDFCGIILSYLRFLELNEIILKICEDLLIQWGFHNCPKNLVDIKVDIVMKIGQYMLTGGTRKIFVSNIIRSFTSLTANSARVLVGCKPTNMLL